MRFTLLTFQRREQRREFIEPCSAGGSRNVIYGYDEVTYSVYTQIGRCKISFFTLSYPRKVPVYDLVISSKVDDRSD